MSQQRLTLYTDKPTFHPDSAAAVSAEQVASILE